jgi:hypothetical protein
VKRDCPITEGSAHDPSTALSVQRASKRYTKRLPGFVSRNKISRAEGEPVRAQPASTLEGVNEEKTAPQRVSEERKAQQAQTTRYHWVTNNTEERCAPLNHAHLRRAKRAVDASHCRERMNGVAWEKCFPASCEAERHLSCAGTVQHTGRVGHIPTQRQRGWQAVTPDQG